MIFEQLTLALKTEFALKFFKPTPLMRLTLLHVVEPNCHFCYFANGVQTFSVTF